MRTGAEVAGVYRARAVLSAGMIAQNDQAWDRSVTWRREALAIYRAEGAAGGEAETLFALGRTFQALSDAMHNEDMAREATRCFDVSGGCGPSGPQATPRSVVSLPRSGALTRPGGVKSGRPRGWLVVAGVIGATTGLLLAGAIADAGDSLAPRWRSCACPQR